MLVGFVSFEEIMARTRLVLLVISAVCVANIEGSAETMKDLTVKFLTVLDECKKQLNLSDKMLSELYYFWHDVKPLSRDLGCVIVCMSQKLNIHDAEGNLQHSNAKDFAVQNGADEEKATILVNIIDKCEKETSQQDLCLKALDIAKCFKNSIAKLEWTPDMNILTEI